MDGLDLCVYGANDLEARQQFDDGHQVLDLAGDFPGLWER